MNSFLYPTPPCKHTESFLSLCATPKVPKVDSSYGNFNGNIGSNYNFYTRHLHPSTSLQPKSSYNVSTYWLYSFTPPSAATHSYSSQISKFGKLTVHLVE